MSDIAIQQVVQRMRSMAAAAAGETADNGSAGSSFPAAMAQSIAEVNQAMLAARRMSDAFEEGQPGVSLTEVMVNSQKASLEFQALTELRNKLLSAYQEVMNMQL